MEIGIISSRIPDLFYIYRHTIIICFSLDPGSIVETAVENKIPFVVVPCCVFSRLFPDRVKPIGEDHTTGITDDGSNVVRTYHDLIDWLVAKHPSIRVTRLPFDGANLAVWSTFTT